jgi:hypothetical protein
VVTSDTPNLGGFTIQDAGDGDAATSDAVFVLSATDVALGDVVTVQGTVTEQFTLTQVGTSGSGGVQATVDVCATGAAAPAAAILPMPSTDAEREAFESMLVDIVAPLVVTGTFGIERFGEVRLSTGGILPTPTDVAEPGAAALAVEAENRTREITVDDGSSRQNPPVLAYLTPDDTVRIGDPVEDLGSHVLSYSFNQWRLQPVTGRPDQVVFGTGSPRTPDRGSGRRRRAGRVLQRPQLLRHAVRHRPGAARRRHRRAARPAGGEDRGGHRRAGRRRRRAAGDRVRRPVRQARRRGAGAADRGRRRRGRGRHVGLRPHP